MAGSGVPCVAEPPGALREEDAEEGEEEPGDFKPENTPGMGKRSPDGFPKVSCAGGHSAASLSTASSVGWTLLLRGMSGLRRAVAEHSRGDTDTDAQFASNASRLHVQKCSSRSRFELPLPSIGSNVRKTCIAPRETPGWKRSESLNQKLRNLVQQLGEAIHESVSESEHIAGVVKDIRKQGFDVLLMLEATIGLNELEHQPSAQREEPSDEVEGSGDRFTTQDLNFLKSLRISVEEHEDRR